MSDSPFLAGKYRVTVASQTFTKAKTGTDQFELRFDPIGRYNDQTGELEACASDQRTIFRPITAKTVKGFFEDLSKLFGFDKESFVWLDPETPDHISFVGQELDVRLKFETWQGKVQERWEWDTPRQSTNQRLTFDELKKLDTLYGTAKPAPKLPAKRNGKKPAAKPAEVGAETEANGDDGDHIPF